MIQFSAKGIIWDLDGTLLNGQKILEDGLSRVFRRHHIPVPTHATFMKNYHGNLRDTIHSLTELEGDRLDSMCDEFIRSEDHNYEHPGGLYYPDAVRLLQQCHAAGLRQVLITNRTHHNDDRLGSPRNLAAKPPLAGYIEAVVCGDDNEFHKPDARVLDDVERKLGLTRNSLIVIGDQFVDAELAHNLEVQAILVTRKDASIPYLDRLLDGWQKHVTVVQSLKEVSISVSERGLVTN